MPSRDVPAPHFQNLLQNIKSNDSSFEQTIDEISNPTATPLPPPSALIVGGSMGGCCAAIALASIGCPVTILERMPGELPSQGAGLVIQPDMADFLLEYKVCLNSGALSDLSIRSCGRQYVDKQGNIIAGDEEPQLFSAWDVLYRALRAAVPDTSYRAGCAVQKIITTTHHQHNSTLDKEKQDIDLPTIESRSTATATTANNKSNSKFQVVLKDSEEKLSADLLIGADGPGSLVRSHFLNKERSEYQGYVAWRGVLKEEETPPMVLSFLGTKFTVFKGDNFHILSYLIPGSNGETTPGKRRVNWVWYWNYPEESLPEILIDIHGKSHGFSVPRGFLKNEIAEKVKENSKIVLPVPLSEMVCATKDIFVQAIHDYLASQLVFSFPDEISPPGPSGGGGGGSGATVALAATAAAVLVGDAGCILRPHTAAGTTKAAINAWALAKCLKSCGFQLNPALKRYNESMLALGRELVNVGVEIGTKSQFPEKVAAAGEINE